MEAKTGLWNQVGGKVIQEGVEYEDRIDQETTHEVSRGVTVVAWIDLFVQRPTFPHSTPRPTPLVGTGQIWSYELGQPRTWKKARSKEINNIALHTTTVW
jgi:hypothetical protein